MVFEISSLKKIRKQLELTQGQFAKKAGISQSMIAKIESGKLDPTYSKVKQIEQALDDLEKLNTKFAKDLMTKHIISVKEKTSVIEVIKLMKKHEISQLPVMENSKVVGLVSESSILSKNIDDLKKLNASDVMVDSPPIIDKNAKIEVLKQLLIFYPVILIKEKGNIIGLVSKADLINSLVK